MDESALRSAAVAASQQARDLLNEGVNATPHAAAGSAASIARIVGRLFAVEGASAIGELSSAMTGATHDLREVLAELQSPDLADHQALAEAVARSLALLYPARRELERTAGARSAEPALPLTRRRTSRVADERRDRPRTELVTDIGFLGDTNFYTGFSGNVSDGGLFVATYDLLPVGTALTVSFVLPDGHQVFAEGQVAWLREGISLDSDLTPGMGIAFERLRQEDHRAISGFMQRRTPMFVDL